MELARLLMIGIPFVEISEHVSKQRVRDMIFVGKKALVDKNFAHKNEVCGQDSGAQKGLVDKSWVHKTRCADKTLSTKTGFLAGPTVAD